MKTPSTLNHIARLCLSLVVVTGLLLGLVALRPTETTSAQPSVHARTHTLLADGSESNGGKGGKPGSKRAGLA